VCVQEEEVELGDTHRHRNLVGKRERYKTVIFHQRIAFSTALKGKLSVVEAGTCTASSAISPRHMGDYAWSSHSIIVAKRFLKIPVSQDTVLAISSR
jgi:hypothetical protein